MKSSLHTEPTSPTDSDDEHQPTRYRWLMLFVAFLSQNMAVGLTFASVGLLMEPLSADLDGSRSLLSLSIAFVILAKGLLGPVVGVLVDRWSLRGTMMIGCLLGAIGFVGASQATSTGAYLLFYGLFVGLSFAMMGVLPANKIITLWFPHVIGRVSGFVNVPLFNMIGPPLYALIILEAGWRSLLILFACAYILLMMLCGLIRPPRGAQKEVPSTLSGKESVDSSLFRSPVFWVLCLIYGLLMSSGIMVITHAAPNAQDHGVVLTQASILMSILGVCGIIGNFLFGWLCDRLTPFSALVINAAMQAVMWVLLASSQGFIPMAVAIAGIGLGSAGVVPIFIAILNTAYDSRKFGRIYGLVGLVGFPFAFSAAPIAGLLFDSFGSYQLAFVAQGGVCALTLILALFARKLLVESEAPMK